MDAQKWGVVGLAALCLVGYQGSQSGIAQLRENGQKYQGTGNIRERYGPSLEWLDRLANASVENDQKVIAVDPKTGTFRGDQSEVTFGKAKTVKLDFSVLSSLMIAGVASGFKSQVANLLWMKSDEYWHQGLFTRQVPLMEAVVTLDPQFIEAWSTAGWHWAYNIYADIPMNETYKNKPKLIRQMQDDAIEQGLNYLQRGANQNPDTYRLWFEWGWTRAEKAGKYDDDTLALYKKARTVPDARLMEQTVQENGKTVTKKVQGLDVLGRTIAHLLERRPQFDQALDYYCNELMKPMPLQRRDLDAVGDFWRRYGTDYAVIGQVYQGGDATLKAQIKQLVPDVERLIQANNTRNELSAFRDKGQPVGAYITITARYMPAWKLMEAGKYQEAVNLMNGVMNVDPKYHLQGLPVLAKVLELRGDAPEAIKSQLAAAREAEKTSSQDIGLHFLAVLLEKAAQNAKDPKDKMANYKEAYRTWYRSRERDALDFYALRNTRLYELPPYNFTTPEDIVKEIKESRKGGVPNAVAPVAPNIAGYLNAS